MLFMHLFVNIVIIAIVTAKKSLSDFRRWLIIRKELLRLKKKTKKQKEAQKDNHYGIRRKTFNEYEESADEDSSEEEPDLEAGYTIKRKPIFKKMRLRRRNKMD